MVCPPRRYGITPNHKDLQNALACRNRHKAVLLPARLFWLFCRQIELAVCCSRMFRSYRKERAVFSPSSSASPGLLVCTCTFIISPSSTTTRNPADSRKALSPTGRAVAAALDEKLVAVGEPDVFGFKPANTLSRRFSQARKIRASDAAHGRQHAFEYMAKAFVARVHNPALASMVLGGRKLKRDVSSRRRAGARYRRHGRLPAGALGGLRGHGKYRALGGLVYRTARLFPRPISWRGEQSRVGMVMPEARAMPRRKARL